MSNTIEVPPRGKLDLPTLAVIVITNFVTLVGSFFAMQAAQEQTQSAFMTTALEEVRAQSREIVELRGMLLASQINVVELEAKVRLNLDEHELLAEFLDALPFPAWIKKYREEDNSFVMHILNQQFTADFGYTSNQFVGKTDYDIHDKDLADDYHLGDSAVLRTGLADIREHAFFDRSGNERLLYIYSFAIILPNGKAAVGSVAIDKTAAGKSRKSN